MRRFYFLLLTLLILAANAIAQTYPVSSQLQLSPPYSVYFSDLLRPEADQVKLNLLLRDLQEPFLDVRLRLKVEGPGITLETATWYQAPAITLESGIPQLLTSIELAPYFNAANLNFGGISRSKYEQQGGRLPEGLYRISFTVFDATTGRQLSQPGQAIAWMALSEPPRLNLPFCDAEVSLDNGSQYIVFQWATVGVSPNTFGELEYEFTLTEIRPDGRDPYEAMRTLPPVYQFTTHETSLVYDNDEPLLIPGMSYAWRVQAKDINGKERFREQGFSPVCTFRVAETALPSPIGVRAEAITSYQGRTYWDLNPEVEDYRVEYRVADGTTWYGINEPEQAGGFIDGELNLSGLAPGNEYEVRVGSRRDGLVSSWSESVYFTTPEEQILACGDIPPSLPIEEFDPLPNASVGDVIAANHVDMTLVSFSGNNGVYSGWGTVKIKFLGERIPVEFENIKVNKNYRMVEGSLYSIQSDIDDYIKDWRDNQDGNADDADSGSEGSNSGEATENEGEGQGDNSESSGGNASEGDNTDTDTGSGGEGTNQPDGSGTGDVTDDETPDDSGGDVDGSGNNTDSGENNDATDGVYGPPIQILHDGTPYVDKDEIEILYDNQNYIYSLELTNYPEDASIRWEVYDMDNQSVTASLTEGGSTTDKTYKVKMTKKYNKLRVVTYYNDKYVTVYLNRERPDFDLQKLLAIDKASKGVRKAEDGETLYLVRKSNEKLRMINYELQTQALNKDFWINEPEWTTTAKGDGTANFTRQTDKKRTSHYLSGWPSTTTTTVNAFGSKKVVKIQLVKANRKKEKASLPPPIDDAINKVITTFNKITKKLKSTTGGAIDEASLKNEFTRELYNTEDVSSRHYYKNRDLSIGITGAISTGEIPLPGYSIKVPKIMTIGAYIKPSISLNIAGGTTEKQRSETNNWTVYSTNFGGKVTGSVEGGVVADVLPTVDEVTFFVKGYAKANAFGAVKYRKISNATEPNEIVFSCGVDPLVVGVNASVKVETILLDMKLLDYSKEWLLLDRIEFKAEPIKF